MSEYLSPGVYVEEFDNGVKAMEGVSTSTAGFVGRSVRGPVEGRPTLITSIPDFTRKFGSYLANDVKDRYLAYAVEQFFANGGSSCYVVRVANASDTVAKYVNKDKEEEATLIISASSVGTWGNELKIKADVIEGFKSKLNEKVDANAEEIAVVNAVGFKVNDYIEIKCDDISERCRIRSIDGQKIRIENDKENKLANAFDLGDEANPKTVIVRVIDYQLTISYGNQEEVFVISLNKDCNEYIDHVLRSSSYITLKNKCNIDQYVSFLDICNLLDQANSIVFAGGTSGDVDISDYKGRDNGPGKRTGIQALLELYDVNIVAVPGITDVAVQLELVNQCENRKDRFAILDMPENYKGVDQILEHRSYFDSTYAAVYHPWLIQFDSLAKMNKAFPPSGAMAGIYARVDTSRGVFKAPANETIKNTLDLTINYNEAEQGKVNPKGVNLIRKMPGMGVRVWGTRTCSSDGNWKYINVRRLFIFIEQSIYANTSWAVFEPNDETLWNRVSSTIQLFLNTQWRSGALMGSTPEEAYYVKVGKGITMSDDDILNGRLICEIGIAPVRPAEFIVFRITQRTATGE